MSHRQMPSCPAYAMLGIKPRARQDICQMSYIPRGRKPFLKATAMMTKGKDTSLKSAKLEAEPGRATLIRIVLYLSEAPFLHL